MAVDLNQMAADDAAYAKQAAVAPPEQSGDKTPPSPLQRFTAPIGRATTSAIDSAVSEAESWGSAISRVGRDVTAGAVTGATNIADAAGSAISASGKGLAAAEDPEHADAAFNGQLPTSPIWDHAKSAIMDFRDAVAVQDPNMVDRLTQGLAQFAVPFAGYSRMLSGLHGIANMVVAGAATDATVLGPHDMRMADLISLGRNAEGKLGQVLRALTPDGSATNAYITYLTSGHAAATPDERAQHESEAEGRFKNVLDGFGANLIATPLLAAAASVFKYGTAGLRYMVENGVGSAGELTPAAQRGAVGDLKYSNENGMHSVASANGYTHAVETAGGDLRVVQTHTEDAARGQGEGSARMERLAQEWHPTGKAVISDVSVSKGQQATYESLKRRGYDVQRNPGAVVNEDTGNLISDDPRKPVFTLGPKKGD